MCCGFNGEKSQNWDFCLFKVELARVFLVRWNQQYGIVFNIAASYCYYVQVLGNRKWDLDGFIFIFI